MIEIRNAEIEDIQKVVEIHLKAFKGFFLSFLGEGFLKHLYKHFIIHNNSNLLIAKQDAEIVGFVAYSANLSDFYKTLLKQNFFSMGWYSFCGACRNPKIILKLLRSFTYSKAAKKEEKYIQLSSIGVLPEIKSGVGSILISGMKKDIEDNFKEQGYSYIHLETDAIENESVNNFYKKNGFEYYETFVTAEGRKMNDYRYYLIDKK